MAATELRSLVMSLPLALIAVFTAQPPATIDVAAFDRLVIETLRDVHNRGAALYNDSKDYPGCYRFYEGTIRTIRPLLAHRPAIQKSIDEDMAKLDAMETSREKAFRLHEMIESIRKKLKDTAQPPPTAPSPKSVPGNVAPPPVSLMGVPAAPDSAGALSGTVSLDGVPAENVELMFVSLDRDAPLVRSVTSSPFGRYTLSPAPPAGSYIVAATGPGVPAKFGTTTESGLRIRIVGASDRIDFNLKK
jgi:hypothetical protein